MENFLKKKFPVLLLVFLFSSGIAGAGGNTPENPKENSSSSSRSEKKDAVRAAEDSLEELRQAYLSKNLNEFFENVDENYYSSHTDLKMRVGSRFSRFEVMDLRFTVDHTLVEGDKVVLQTHWQKRSVRQRSGNVRTRQGSADFVFRLEGAEAVLLDIQKDNPF